MGVSVDGAEGPGAWGLNREVAMTVVVGKDGKATANFALVQPSVQSDGPKIFAAMLSPRSSANCEFSLKIANEIAPITKKCNIFKRPPNILDIKSFIILFLHKKL